MESLRTRYVLLGLLLALSGQASAGWWEDVQHTVGSVGAAVWQGAVAPTNTVINAAQAATGQKSPNQIFDPYKQLAKTNGDLLQDGYSLAQQPQDFFYRRALQYSQDIDGDSGSFMFDVATFNSQLMNELGSASINATANVLRGEDPLQLVGAPLAGAIRAARQRFSGKARPLPEDVARALAPYFDPSVLARAKYAVGNVEITLPTMIGQSYRLMGSDYAVTVDDIIVFNTSPPSIEENPDWWAHEMTHVRQYAAMGVEEFAWNYVRDFGQSLESEARGNGGNIAQQINNGGQGGPGSSGPMTGPPQPVQEYGVAQCVFYDNNGGVFPVHYVVTNMSNIYAVNDMTGQTFQVGWATPPRAPNVAWTYQTPNYTFAVMSDGSILFPQENWRPVGYVVASNIR
ncbi:DUF4157 domain-containing protein [Dyella sp. EPa41]|uniref:DUF4157 domain-containing protein n=1 Tax=Dyella sp. EPa41 TaxID=1561194 RepID=UPI001916A247|nr:DUF4157 domain-containing protein [Dyella sp. EPa41]